MCQLFFILFLKCMCVYVCARMEGRMLVCLCESWGVGGTFACYDVYVEIRAQFWWSVLLVCVMWLLVKEFRLTDSQRKYFYLLSHLPSQSYIAVKRHYD